MGRVDRVGSKDDERNLRYFHAWIETNGEISRSTGWIAWERKVRRATGGEAGSVVQQYREKNWAPRWHNGCGTGRKIRMDE